MKFYELLNCYKINHLLQNTTAKKYIIKKQTTQLSTTKPTAAFRSGADRTLFAVPKRVRFVWWCKIEPDTFATLLC